VSGDVCVCWCIYFSYFYDFDILNWNCSECAVCFVPSVWYALFRVCGIFFLHFITNTKKRTKLFCQAVNVLYRMHIRARKLTSMHAHKHVYTQTHNTLFNLAGTKRHIIAGCPCLRQQFNFEHWFCVRHWNVAAWININDVIDFTHQTPDIELVKICH
jgi:hypothetical protein